MTQMKETQMSTSILPASPNAGASVSLENLVRTYGSVRALDGLSLKIEPGEFMALLLRLA